MSGKTKFAFAFFLLLLLGRFFLFLTEAKPSYFPGQTVNFQAVLDSQPQLGGKTQRFEIQGIAVVTGRFPEYQYGQVLKITGVAEKSKENWVLPFPQIEVVKKTGGNLFLRKIYQLQKKLVGLYQRFLPQPSAELLAGIVLGVKTTMPADFSLALRQSGTMHVVAASGMNVTMVASFLSGFLIFFFNRRLALVFCLFGIFFYAALAGFQASIVRAGIMGAIAAVAQILGRQNWGVLSLLLAAYLMLFVKPTLIFDLGFQLSFLATTGLLFIKPLLKNLAKIPLIGDDFSTTLAAQAATLPLLFANFGQYSVLSILANALTLWTIPWVMGFGGAMGILGFVFQPAAQFLGYLTFPLLFYFEKIVVFFGSLPFGLLKVSRFPWQFFLGYYFLLTAFLVWRHGKNSK